MEVKDLIMSNIDALCKMQNKKKGELEKYLGHTPGYLAGKKDGRELTWNQLNEISLFFEVPVQDLVTYDFIWDAEIYVNRMLLQEDEENMAKHKAAMEYALEMRDKANGRG